jgi:hypothetical protein
MNSPGNKSLLLLFFRKEGLLFFEKRRRPPCGNPKTFMVWRSA